MQNCSRMFWYITAKNEKFEAIKYLSLFHNYLRGSSKYDASHMSLRCVILLTRYYMVLVISQRHICE